MYTDVKLGEYLDALASKASTPGGGSVAAISGATGAALVSMVCNLTIGKEKFKDVEPQVQDILARAERLRADLTGLIDEDMKVFGDLMTAYALPRNTDEEKQTRSALLQERAKGSAMAPYKVAEGCAAVMDLCIEAGKVGNPMAISDIGVAVLLAEAGLESAFLNVEINFNIIKDEAFIEDLKAKVASLAAGRDEMRASVLATVRERM